MKIFKYQINEKVTMPSKSTIIKFQVLNDVAYIWAVVDESSIPITRTFRWYATGVEIHEYNVHEYIDTWFDNNGRVWHLFEYFG